MEIFEEEHSFENLTSGKTVNQKEYGKVKICNLEVDKNSILG
jgi:hypothetical protein